MFLVVLLWFSVSFCMNQLFFLVLNGYLGWVFFPFILGEKTSILLVYHGVSRWHCDQHRSTTVLGLQDSPLPRWSMPLLGTFPKKWGCWSGGSYFLRGLELKKITPWKITLPETNSSHPKTFMRLCSMLIFRGVLCNLRLQCSNLRLQL